MTVTCGVCAKACRNEQGLGGHMKHSKDAAHRAARDAASAAGARRAPSTATTRTLPATTQPRGGAFSVQARNDSVPIPTAAAVIVEREAPTPLQEWAAEAQRLAARSLEAYEQGRREREERERADIQAREDAERARREFEAAYVPFDSALPRVAPAASVAVRPGSRPNESAVSSVARPATQGPSKPAETAAAPITTIPAPPARPPATKPVAAPNGSTNGATSVMVETPKPRGVETTASVAAPVAGSSEAATLDRSEPSKEELLALGLEAATVALQAAASGPPRPPGAAWPPWLKAALIIGGIALVVWFVRWLLQRSQRDERPAQPNAARATARALEHAAQDAAWMRMVRQSMPLVRVANPRGRWNGAAWVVGSEGWDD